MTAERWLHDPALASRVESFLDEREPGRHRDEVDLRTALRWLHTESGPLFDARANAPALASVARVIATVAWHDLALAFSLWNHRMVLEYVAAAEAAVASSTLEKLERAELIGCTALAAGLAHHVMGVPLPIAAKRSRGGLLLDGRVRWASNLFERGFLLVTTVDLAGEGPCAVAIPGTEPGLSIDPYPSLLALQSTQSSSLRLSALELPLTAILSRDFARFVGRIRPPFLLLQSSFCWGLAARSLHEASKAIGGGLAAVFAPEHAALTAELDRIEAALDGCLGVPPPSVRPWVVLRLEAARLAGAATRLESKVAGGGSFVAGSPAARRQLEAAFLPVQSPTEGQLVWEVTRSS